MMHGPLLAGEVLEFITDTLPSAVLECWTETAVIGVSASADLFGVSGFTELDWEGPEPTAGAELCKLVGTFLHSVVQYVEQ